MNVKSYFAALRRSSFVKWLACGLIVLAAWFALHCALVSLDGFADSFSPSDPADAEVVLGNEVLRNATPGDLLRGRLQKALDIFQSGAARHIVCSGGKGPGDLWEAHVMRDWLAARGVKPSRIIVNNGGKDSYSTARGAKVIFDAHGWKSALIVSNFTHISRCKLAFRRFGISDVRGAHADFAWSDFKGFPHEFLGYYFYWVRK